MPRKKSNKPKQVGRKELYRAAPFARKLELTLSENARLNRELKILQRIADYARVRDHAGVLTAWQEYEKVRFGQRKRRRVYLGSFKLQVVEHYERAPAGQKMQVIEYYQLDPVVALRWVAAYRQGGAAALESTGVGALSDLLRTPPIDQTPIPAERRPGTKVDRTGGLIHLEIPRMHWEHVDMDR